MLCSAPHHACTGVHNAAPLCIVKAKRWHPDVTPSLHNPLPCTGITVVQQRWRHGCLFGFVHLHPRGEALLVWRPCKPDANRVHSGFTLEHPLSSRPRAGGLLTAMKVVLVTDKFDETGCRCILRRCGPWDWALPTPSHASAACCHPFWQSSLCRYLCSILSTNHCPVAPQISAPKP